MINPYKSMSAEDFTKMHLRSGVLVVQGILADSYTSIVTLADSRDFKNAIVHQVIASGTSPGNPEKEPQVGDRCFVLGNTLSPVDGGWEFCFVETEDIWAWWPYGHGMSEHVSYE